MKIRTQLVIAFLVFSVLPLTGIVLYSYYSSTKAVRSAYAADAAATTRQMDIRMTSLTNDLRQEVQLLGERSFAGIEAGSAGADPGISKALAEMGEKARLLESFQIIPAAKFKVPKVKVGKVEVPDVTVPQIVVKVPKAKPSPAPAAAAAPVDVEGAESPEPPEPPEAIVIDMDQILAELPSAEEMAAASQTPPVPPAPPVAPAPGTTPSLEAIERYQEQMAQYERYEHQRAEYERARQAERIKRDAIRREIARQREEINAQIAARIERNIKKSTERAKRHTETDVERQERARKAAKDRQLHFDHNFEFPILENGQVAGVIKANVRGNELLRRVWSTTERDAGEIPFAFDGRGNLYAPDDDAREKLARMDVSKLGEGVTTWRNLLIATRKDPTSGLTLGIARPIREPLEEVRRTAGRNFVYGLALIGLALLGIVPLANHMTRDVALVTEGASRIAAGDLTTEVPVRSDNEFGQLASTFNDMARQLAEHQKRLVEEERLRRDQEIQQRLLAAEYERKSEELEEARRFQISLLPKSIPEHPLYEIAVYMKTATEVGGDYYDFNVSPEGVLTVAVGDATGHGARAGTMVTVIKSLFSTYSPEDQLGTFLTDAGETIRRMDLGRMAMALSIMKLSDSDGSIAAAGMPPLLIYRSQDDRVDEISIEGLPLGTKADTYEAKSFSISRGDTLLLMSDGFPELMGVDGEPLGYTASEEHFRTLGSKSAREVIDGLAAIAESWSGGKAPNDDITFVAIKRV